jgi:hypothetical protein
MSNNYSFAGIGHVEAQDRTDEYRTGVPSLGDGQELLTAPAPGARQILSRVHAHNTGEEAAFLRLMHQGASKVVAAELLAAFADTATHYAGSLQFKAITPGSVTITNAGAPVDIVDDGLGVLHDVGIPANTRGTVDYANGVLDWTFGGAPTQPVSVAYTHTDYTDFASATQTTSHVSGGDGTGGTPELIPLTFGRVVPGTIAFTDGGGDTFVDDGKGNIVETTVTSVVVGTVDYATGIITVLTATDAITGTFNVTYQFNPFASLLAAAGGQALMDLFNAQIPELTQEPWADGLKGEARVGLWGESRSNAQTNLVTMWGHASEEPFRVEAPFSGFPPGGHDNDPRIVGG